MSSRSALSIARRAKPTGRARVRRVAMQAPAIGCPLGTSAATTAAELIVVEQAGCVHCARFDAEIAGAWPNTEEGRHAPLRRVDPHGRWPVDLAGIEKPTVTPAVVLLDDDGPEIDRLVGYPGDEHFRFLIDRVLDGLEAR